MSSKTFLHEPDFEKKSNKTQMNTKLHNDLGKKKNRFSWWNHNTFSHNVTLEFQLKTLIMVDMNARTLEHKFAAN